MGNRNWNLGKNTTYNVLNLKPVPQGTSGGISIIGSIGAMMGSFTITLSGIRWVDISYIHYMILILLAGLFKGYTWLNNDVINFFPVLQVFF